jgi:predicted dehydrogenase/NADPH:quinone reductase-like Zn-dependent oxidoreductase
MKQLLQSLKTGELALVEVPPPAIGARAILVRTHASLVSAGTERNMVGFAEKNLLAKARSRPDLVRQVVDKARRDGVLSTVDAVKSRLDQAVSLGYSAAGTVLEVGAEAGEFHPGDRVACAGGGFAVHAQVLSVPRNLAVKLPDAVTFEQAAFTTVGAIALHGVRIAEVQLGEVVAVIGLGLLGQIAIQILKAAGCIVIGTDLLEERVELARRTGIDFATTDAASFAAQVASRSGGHGADSVLIAADTKSDQPVVMAGEVARNRGRVVSLGVVGTHLPRKIYFEKELDFRISRSYGPGRYDSRYEEKGEDYPYGYVRWTENRNMQAFAAMVGSGAVDVESLISHRFEIEDAVKAYDLILGHDSQPSLGVVLKYTAQPDVASRVVLKMSSSTPTPRPDSMRVAFLGAGNFAKAVLLPAFREAGAELVGVATSTSASAHHAAQRFGFRYCTTDEEQILNDAGVNAVVIATRHDQHAAQTIRAVRAGKHVFVEKPLCLTEEELDAISGAHAEHPSILMVGFNRRFAPMSIALRDFMRAGSEPLMIHYRVNGGFVPATEWVQREQGGGRLVGEGVHFIDWAIWLTGDVPESVQCVAADNAGRYSNDNFSVVMRFRNGSVFQLLYVASGDRALGKERVEVHGGERSAVLEDFRRLELFSNGRKSVTRSMLRSDKGHRAGVAAFANAVRSGGASPIPFDELVTTMRAAFDARRSLAT